MAELERPLRSLLRDPATPARKDAVWQRVAEHRQGGARSITGRVALAGLVLALGALALMVASEHQSAPPREVATRTPPAEKVAPGPVTSVTPATPEPAAATLALADGTPIPTLSVALSEPSRLVTLSDGSRIELAPGAALSALASTPAELRLSLTQGSARFEVSPQGTRAFRVVAGPVEVSVVGTGFRVTNTTERVTVEVTHGKVRVRAAALPNGETFLTAGEAAVVPVIKPAAAAAEHSAAENGGAEAAARDAAARGDFERAFSLLGEHGFDDAVADAKSVDQLLLLADTARLSGHPRKAVRPLERIAERYPKDERASIAALSLARVQLDQLHDPAQAARVLDRAITLGLPQGLAEDAYARRVEALSKAGEHAKASAAAAEYLTRFPAGRRRAAVQKWATAQ